MIYFQLVDMKYWSGIDIFSLYRKWLLNQNNHFDLDFSNKVYFWNYTSVQCKYVSLPENNTPTSVWN